MAEFKISRFRYTWKGVWNNSTRYIKDDVVRYGGSSWVCIRQHESSVFQTDQEFLANQDDTDFSPAWTKMTDGRVYKGDWFADTLYDPGDIIKYGGNLYLVITSFTSSTIFDNDTINLALYIEGTNWRGSWTAETRYGVGDLVRYGAKTLKCVIGHTSGTDSQGPEIGNNDGEDDSTLEQWQLYYDAPEYRGNYSNDGVRYKIDDVVLYNGGLIRCISVHTSETEFADDNWIVEADGSEFNGEWRNDRYYGAGSVVRYGGTVYRAEKSNYNKVPVNSIYQYDDELGAPYWKEVVKGVNYLGNWSPTASYKTGDVVYRGGVLYRVKLDTTISGDGSSLEYLDNSNWEILVDTITWKGDWAENRLYSKGDVVTFLGSLYRANIEHTSESGLDANFPGDNGSGYFYWDVLVDSPTEIGMSRKGDLLTYNLSRGALGDQSTFGATSVRIGEGGQVLNIDNDDNVIYKTYEGSLERVFYVDISGVDDLTDPLRGVTGFKPFRTIRFACEQANDGFEGFTTVRVGVGEFYEVLPIIIPKRTVVRGAELRSTTIRPKPANPILQDDAQYQIAVLNRLSALMQNVIAGTTLSPAKSVGNPLDPVVLEDNLVDSQASLDIIDLISDIIAYINFYINSTGEEPDISGSNNPVTTSGYTNAVKSLLANKEFLAEEAVAFMRLQYPAYNFNSDDCKRDVRAYVDAWAYDIIYTGNYKSILAARYYKNAVLGSETEDMFYCRDTTGVRNCTLQGLRGTLNPPDAFDLYQRPTGGAYTSLDPGWGPEHRETWIINRSPYIQGVTTLGDNCVGIKIDGALHNGGNKSMVANDYTQVLSDGIGAWALNNGRTELVSVFTYYCTIGYYTSDGGVIRGTNGNCSYGNFGAISDGVDPTETPTTAILNQRTQQAQVYQALAGEFTDEITMLEFTNAGQNYTTASASFTGAGVNAAVSFEDFRDNAVFECRLIDELPQVLFIGSIDGTELTVTSIISGSIGQGFRLFGNGVNDDTQIVGFGTGTGGTGTYNVNIEQNVAETTMLGETSNLVAQYVGGGGYSAQQNNAQVHTVPGGDLTSITIASNDTNEESDYVGKRIILTSGTGTGQYAYITAYDTVTKIVSVARDSDDQPGWDHVIPGRPIAEQLDTTTRYRIEPRVVIDPPPFSSTEIEIPVTRTYNEIVFGGITQNFTNISGDPGTGDVVVDDGLTPVTATFDITSIGRTYTVVLNNPGAGYAIGDEIIIEGDSLGGISPDNDIVITVTGNTDDSTNGITTYTYDGIAASGRFVAAPSTDRQSVYSPDGTNWQAFNFPSSGNWKCLAAGDNRFVAIRRGTNSAAYSFDGVNWIARSMPTTRDWNGLVYGGGKFVAVAGNFNGGAYSTNGINWTAMTLPSVGDSTVNEWIDVAYGKGIYVAIANSNNISASSTDGINWTPHIMDVIADSSQKDWVSIAYGNNRFVAISSQGDIAYSFDGEFWYPGSMPTQDGSTAHSWYKIRYGQGIFFAVGDTGSALVGGDPTFGPTNFVATSEDGVTWSSRTVTSNLNFRCVGFGTPFITGEDSSESPRTPMWILGAASSDKFNQVKTGAKAKGRAYVVSGRIATVTLFDTGSGYDDPPTVQIIDPNKTSNAGIQSRLGDGVLTNPEWINRGLGYRTITTDVTINGDGFADSFALGKFITLDNLEFYPGLGAQITFDGLSDRYVISGVTEQGPSPTGGLRAQFRITPDIKVRDNLEHGAEATIQIRYSQCRLTGHDFLDIGTGNFLETNYPEIYATGDYVPEPEAEVYEEDGGRVFYTSTDQSGNFRTGDLFAVEQATGIVTISADFFDLAGLTELRLGGIRIGGSGVVVREFSTDALFTADSNNVVPTQRAIAAYLNNRLTVGGSEIITSSFIAGLVRVGPDIINSTVSGTVLIPQRVDFDVEGSGISGLGVAQIMFYRSFTDE